MCERERERKIECKCYPFLIISVKARGIYELMLLGKCSRPKQKWTHNSIPLKVPSELSGRGSLSGRVLRTRSPPPLLSAAHGREQGCMEGTELFWGKEFAPPVFPTWLCTSMKKQLSPAAILGLQTILKNRSMALSAAWGSSQQCQENTQNWAQKNS